MWWPWPPALAYPWRSPSTDRSWRIEKRDLATGALVPQFGSCGIVRVSSGSGGENRLRDLALRGDELVIAAVDGYGGQGAWRYERRDAASGVLRSHCASHAGDPSLGAAAVAIDADGVLVVGYDPGTLDWGPSGVAPAGSVIERRR